MFYDDNTLLNVRINKSANCCLVLILPNLINSGKVHDTTSSFALESFLV